MQNRGGLPKQGAFAIASAVALVLAFVVFSFDPPSRLVSQHSGTLLERGAPGKLRPAVVSAPIRLQSGDMVMASVPATLIGAPVGTKLSVSQYRTLIFRRTTYTATPNPR
jgi:hypothetical protein